MSKILINTGPSRRGWHRLELALRCLRLYALSHLLKLDSAHRPALVRGSLLHIGMAHIYAQMRAARTGGDPGRYYDPVPAIEVASHLEEYQPYGEQLREICQDVVASYLVTTPENIDVQAVEEVVEAHFGGKYLLTQRWDLLYKDKSGRFWVRDHKSAAKPNASTIMRYSLSGQFLAAQLIGRARYGDQWGGVELNILGMEKNKKTGAYPVIRERVKPAPGALERFSRDMVEMEDRLAKYAEENRDPWDYPGAWHEHACVTAYGACGFYSLCQWGRSSLVPRVAPTLNYED